jgi:hypothetical protein
MTLFVVWKILQSIYGCLQEKSLESLSISAVYLLRQKLFIIVNSAILFIWYGLLTVGVVKIVGGYGLIFHQLFHCKKHTSSQHLIYLSNKSLCSNSWQKEVKCLSSNLIVRFLTKILRIFCHWVSQTLALSTKLYEDVFFLKSWSLSTKPFISKEKMKFYKWRETISNEQ